ncbi:MAG TPA: PEP-CTERM sorting domain-containing protein [Candidatus Binatia bacterium]|nr:PEP-CTERM sorting domain-containing protein [Candidatus Binatia bacterium]
MRSHFLMSGAATACAVSAATAIMPSVCSAQIAADYATNPTYSGGWAAGQNGGSGFGAWSFNGTDPTPAGTYQGLTSSSPIGTAWTLFTHANNTGLANAGRAISEVGGLQPTQRFETVINNPTAFHFYRGFDLLFTSGPDNNAPGNNAAALRLSVFNYSASNWSVNDAGGGTGTSLSSTTTGAAGLRIALTLNSATTYSLTLTPLNGATPYSQSGTLAGPITWVDYRLWDGTSGGPNDTANNFEISSMTIIPEPSTFALIGLGAGGLVFLRRRK